MTNDPTCRSGALSVRVGVALLVFWFCAASTSEAQSDTGERHVLVQGRVMDDAGQQAISDALVSLADGSRLLVSGMTDSLGYFQLVVFQRSSFTLSVRRLGYQPASVRIPADSLTALWSIALHVAPHALERVAVVSSGWRSSRLAGFEARVRVQGGGTFITRDDIERWHPNRVTTLMRRVNGVRLWDSSSTVLVVSGRGEKVDLRKGVLMGN